VPDLPPGPAGEELLALVATLRASNARLREVIEARDAQLAAAGAALEAAEARIAALSGRVAEMERRLGKDSPTSSRPPSSDSPYKKRPRDRSLRGRSGRKPGKQPGAESSTLRQASGVPRTASSVVMPWTISLASKLPSWSHGVAADPQHVGGVREIDALGVGNPDGPPHGPAVAVIGGSVVRFGAAVRADFVKDGALQGRPVAFDYQQVVRAPFPGDVFRSVVLGARRRR